MTKQARAVAVTRAATVGVLALALVLAVLVLGATHSRAGAGEPGDVHPEWGSTSAKNGVLKRGCRNYSFSYSINPPKGDWALETFVVGPKGVALASDGFLIGFDEKQGSSIYRICRASTKPGIFKIKAKISALDGDELTEGWLPVTKFRLRAKR